MATASLATRHPSPIMRVLHGEHQAVPPVWLMRQAGRYLEEYRALRAEKGSFLNLVYNSEAAAEITLQPIRRFGFDAAILFSDILIVPHALGQALTFGEGEGPRLVPPLEQAELADLAPAPQHFQPIYGTVARTRAALAPDKALLGFAGSPWTVATYMVAGEGSKEQAAARLMGYADPGKLDAIITAISDSTLDYLSGQIKAGADAVMLFDSWSGSLAPSEFERWVIAPTARLVERLRGAHPGTPIIGFPKGAHEKLPAYARETAVDALGLDEAVCPAWAHANLPSGLPVQGNLDPMVLKAGGAPLDRAVDRLKTVFQDRPHIFNLGHGIDRFTPVNHVHQLLERLRG